MEVRTTRLEGPLVISPVLFEDARGFFFESFRRDQYFAAGIADDFLQDNHSRSIRGTVRAFHFQTDPGQAKLVRVARGRAWDVVVDLRRRSPTFGEWESFDLDDELNEQLYIPVGFAHGFCAVSDIVDFVYKVGSYYDASTERGVAWDDPRLNVPWPVARAVVSPRDNANPRLDEIADSLPNWSVR